MFFQFIAATNGELIKKILRPIRLIYLIRIIEEIMRIGRFRRLESTLETLQIILHGTGGQMIHHVSLTTGGRPFHFLESFPTKSSNQFPITLRCFPLQSAVFCHLIRHINTPAFIRISHKPAQLCIRQLFGIGNHYFFLKRLPALPFIFSDEKLTGSIFYPDFRASKRPSGPSVHINLHPQAGSFTLRILQHLHPRGRKKWNLICLIPLDPINRGDLHRSHPCFRIGIQITG